MKEKWQTSILRICESLHAHVRGYQITPSADLRAEFIEKRLLDWKPNPDSVYDKAVHEMMEISIKEFRQWQNSRKV